MYNYFKGDNMKLYTNSNEKLDFMGKRLENISKNTNLYISVAFFSHSDYILSAIKNGCSKIDLIIRLDFGTNPDELLKLIDNPNVNIRYYSSKHFHPKLYIIDGFCAFVGSSNLTHNGLGKNLELNIEIDSDEPIYDDLMYEFLNEWENAAVLTKDVVIKFKQIYEANRSRIIESDKIIISQIGETAPQNISILDKKEKSSEYLENFRRKYQQYISAFQRLEKMYNIESDKRKYDSDCPLRIEIDGFLSWLWDYKCDHNSYSERPILTDEDIKSDVLLLKSEFLEIFGINYYDNLPKIHAIPELDSKDKIDSLSIEAITDLLERVWAFHDRLRFFTGGLSTMKTEFIRRNGHKIKETISYILFGKEDYVVRIYNSLFSKQYKLDLFGDSCVKELYGLLNKDNIPICNGRTQKVMQWLGFGKL
jgi:HKD family nuclease